MLVRLSAATVLALALSACSMGGLLPTAPAGGGSQQLANATATPDEMAQQANMLPAIATECPPIKVRPGFETLYFYGQGKARNPQDLQYQAVIDKQSRNCVVSNGLITVEMGVAGRLMLGPSGNQTNVELPLNFTVQRDGTSLFSETYEIPVAITPPSQASEFVKVVPNVSIPYIGGEDLVIWVGFDSGKGKG
ncbi:MAG: hypothetical protein ABIO40_12450 [Devosia sp.]